MIYLLTAPKVSYFLNLDTMRYTTSIKKVHNQTLWNNIDSDYDTIEKVLDALKHEPPTLVGQAPTIQELVDNHPELFI